ncbi:S8 family serine peptidase [Coraliomargarita sp. SDUM461004]|uniref:S8 family serine peptidase n=1 Tax=Thalassobacterium sedimentorum TaxID=3041258 RepID=A0ABU1AJB0_9BACT|nr:S8 family serine peptidase [Coraliomargarita sp. SDUM461004]MDQ8194904.1 S8 family serine peptidase [Coraliomargarita sp. SDUM461004]
MGKFNKFYTFICASAVLLFLFLSQQGGETKYQAIVSTLSQGEVIASADDRLLSASGNTVTNTLPSTRLDHTLGSTLVAESRDEVQDDDARLGSALVSRIPGFLDSSTTQVLRTWEIPKDAHGPRRFVRLYETDFHYPLIRSEEVVPAPVEDAADAVQSVRSMVADHLIVMPEAGTSKEQLRQAILAAGYEVRDTPATSPFLLAAFDPLESEEALTEAQREIATMTHVVASVEPDYLKLGQLAANDPAYEHDTLWGLNHYSNYDIDAREAWERRTSAAEVVVAILDTGILTFHEDLAANMWVNSAEIAGDGIDNDGNGWIDDIHGANFINPLKSPDDDNGHGTHVAGTVGAVGNNSIGVTGVAWDVQLMALKFLGENGLGTTSGAISGVYYAVNMGADIINGSFGGGGESAAMQTALAYAYANGVIFVASAGNNSGNNDYQPQFPASYDLNNIVSVASHRRDGELSTFSNFGSGTVDLSAPGESIWSTSFVMGRYVDGVPPRPREVGDSSYRYLSGTSMAAPHVSGALALLKAEYPDEGVDELLNRLYASVKNTDAMQGKVRFAGILSLNNALELSSSAVMGDAYDDAIELSWPYAEWTGSTVGATVDEALSGYQAPMDGTGSLWFTITSEQDGWMQLGFQASSNEGWVAVFKESQVNETALLSSQSSSRSGYFQTEAGTTYRIRVDSTGEALNTFHLTLMQRAANDNINEAVRIEASNFSVDGFNFAATHEPLEPRHAGVATSRSVWYQWLAAEDEVFYLNTLGSGFDTVLAVYTRDAGVLSEVASDDDGGRSLTSALQFTAESGQEYFFVVDSYRETPAGDFQLNGAYKSDISIYSQPQSRNAKVGDVVTLSVGASSGLDLSYQWYRDGNAIAGGNQSILRFYSLREEDFGSYHCLIRNEHTSVQSDASAIMQFLSAPEIAWQSSSKALASSSYAELSVRAYGSAPLTYQWKKDGVILPDEDAPVLSFNNFEDTDAGIYEVLVSNSEGTRLSRPMALDVVANPLEDWIWRNPLPQGADIRSMLIHDGVYYAVATGTESVLLKSIDGGVWQSIELPGDMRAFDLTYGNGQFVAVGLGEGSFFDPKPVLTSPDGVVWTKHLVSFGNETPQSIEFENGLFVLRTGDRRIWHSSNGIDWSTTSLTNIGMLRAGGGRFLAFKSNSKTVYSSSDGVNWVEATVPSDVWPYWEYCHFIEGYFYVNFSSAVFRSVDGITWDALGNGDLKEVMGFHDGQFYGFEGRSYYTSTSLPNWSGLQYVRGSTTAKDITQAIADNDRILVGGEGGLLASSTTVENLNLEEFNRITDDLDRVISIDHGFYAFWKTSYSGRMYYSADGSDWSQIAMPSSAGYSIGDIHYANGLFWAKSSNSYSSGNQYLYRGTHPASLEPLLNAQQGLLVDIVYGNGRYYMIQYDHGSSSSAKLYESTDGSLWTQNEEISVSGNSRLYAMDGRIIVSSWSRVSVTTDGDLWEVLTLPGGYGYQNGILAEGGKIYVYDAYRKFHISADGGSSWSSHTTNLNLSSIPNLFRIESQFGIVSGSQIYLSADGITWGISALNSQFNDVAFGLNTIVGVGDDGLIMQSGTPVSSAPVCEIVAPVDYGTVSEFTDVPVQITAFDPEGHFNSINCYWRGELVYSSTRNGSHEFNIFVKESGLGDLRAIATDDSGLRTSALIKISVNKSQNPAWYSPYSPYETVGSAQFGDDIYLFTRDGITLRSSDFETWETLQLPKLDSKPSFAVAGNELQILSSSEGVFYTSLDGQNWVASQMEGSNVTLRQALQFNDGIFAAPYSMSSLGDGIVFSVDGFQWFNSPTKASFDLSKIVLGDTGRGLAINSGYSIDTALYTFEITSDYEVQFTNTGLGRAVDAAWGLDRFVAIMADGSVQFSFDLNAWSPAAWAGATPDRIEFLANRFFLFDDDEILACSEDGLLWEASTGDAFAESIEYFSGQYVGVTRSAVYRSLDGVNWSRLASKPSGSSEVWQLADGSYAVAVTNEGIAYSRDLQSWTVEALENDPMRIENIVEGNGIWVANHSLHYPGIAWSEDAGKSWHRPTTGFDGWTMIQSIEDVVYGAGKFLVRINSDLYQSTDGKNWTLVLEGAPTEIRFDRLRGLFVAAASDGRFARSSDGIHWEYFVVDATLNTVAVVPGASMLIALQGTSLSGISDLAISYDNGATWAAGVSPASKIYDFVEIDGAVVLLSYSSYGSYVTYRSTDGLTWTQSATTLPAGSNTPDDLAAGLDGLVYINSDGNLYASVDGLSWELLKQIDFVDGASTVDGKLYLTGSRLILYSEFDWVNRSLNVTAGEYGIGDTIALDFEVFNASSETSTSVPFDIEFRLSKDKYWSDDDAVLGVASVAAGLPDPMQSNQWVTEGTLPDTIKGGSYYVLSQINPNDSAQEKYSNNNFKSTSVASVVVPEWLLNVSTSGDGETGQDTNAVRYTSNAQVNLVALEDKHTEFTGWEGDTPGGLNQLTLTMSEDKDLTASFTSYHLLVHDVVGAGRIDSTVPQDRFEDGETVTLTAVPEDGWSFIRWSGDSDSSHATLDLTMNADQILVAHFGQTYAQWQSAELVGLSGADLEPTGDPDGDQLLNIQEYLSGSDPQLFNQSDEVMSTKFTSSSLVLRYWARRGELDGGIQVLNTSNLDSGWEPLQSHTRIIEEDAQSQYIEVEIPFSEADRSFIKLDYTLNRQP